MDNKYIEAIREINPDALLADGFDDCITGIVQKFEGFVLMYSEKKIIEKLSEEMPEDDAWDYYSFNIVGAYMGEYSPVFQTEIV